MIRINQWLRPVAWLYGIGVRIRNWLFDVNILKSKSYDIPIIAVGNITVGGTGKTPHTEYLIRLLQERFQVAVLSRGYKRKSKGFVLAQTETPMQAIGDEPYQMRLKFPQIYVAVDKDRRHGIEQLCDNRVAPGTEVILLDDAFQHRYVKPGLSILLVDYHRLICDDALLPAGRLRLHFNHPGAVTDYTRFLDLQTAIAGVEYCVGGVHFKREHFAATKDMAIVRPSGILCTAIPNTKLSGWE